jgi:hypothetical protein
MFTLVTFPWPLPSANVPLIEMSSRSVPQPRPTQSAVTPSSLSPDGQDEPASLTGHRAGLAAPKV